MSDQAEAATTNSVLPDARIITPSDKSFVIDKIGKKSELKKTDFLNWSMAYMLMANKMQLWFRQMVKMVKLSLNHIRRALCHGR